MQIRKMYEQMNANLKGEINMETLYFNGDVITMEGEQDFAEAVLVADGVIKVVGSYDAVAAQKAADCQMVDLQGKTLMPSFIDGHGHISMAGVQYTTMANLEDAKNFADITRLLKEFIAEKNIPAGQPVVGFAYDHNFLAEGTHPDKKVLDAASAVHPIAILHTSGHMGVVGSMILKMANVNEDTPEVEGGVIGRYPGSKEPTGYLEETALMSVAMPLLGKVQNNAEDLLVAVQDFYAANGVTTVQDGGTSGASLAMMRHAGQAGRLKVDIVTYPSPLANMTPEGLDAVMPANKDIMGVYKDHVKIGGYKILLDGSPQGKSAWMSEPYENSGDYCGYPWLKDEEVHACIKRAIADNQQLLTHCNGDAASQQLLDIYEEELAASDNPNKNNLRPVMIHCQTVRDDQLDRMAAIKMVPSIFVAHTWYWGDIHLKNFGDRRGRRVRPVKSALDRGLIYNFHTDTPVTRPKMLLSVWAAANRITRNGVEIGPEQRVSVYDALKGITINAAYAYFEEDSKGSIKAGKRADLVILDRNPLKVDKMEVRDIQVMETIKDGVTIYKAE